MDTSFIIGFVLGVIMYATADLARRLICYGSGTLKIDRSDSTKPKYRFELDDSPETIGKKKRYILRIEHNADLSQK